MYFFIRDDSPIEAKRVAGWDGKRPNPYCFNCEHTLGRHGEARISRELWRKAREHGALIDCESCSCKSYFPSHAELDMGNVY